MNEDNIITTALRMLYKNTGMEGEFQHMLKLTEYDVDGELYFPKVQGLPRFKVEVKKELRLYHLRQLIQQAHTHAYFLVLAENIFPTLKEKLRTEGINHLDIAGNIYLKTANQLIWIDGNKYKMPAEAVTNKAFTKTGLKLVFYLLQNKEAVNLPYRQLAEATGTALGTIKNIFDGLRDEGYLLPLTKDTVKLQRRRELLAKWITAYGAKLKPTLFLGTYRFWDRHHQKQWQTHNVDGKTTVWGAEPGAALFTNYLIPKDLTIYTTEKTKLIKDWKLIPDDDGPLQVYEKFWKTEGDTAETNFAPPLLLYADLLLTDDPRCLETATLIYNNYLLHEFD